MTTRRKEGANKAKRWVQNQIRTLKSSVNLTTKHLKVPTRHGIQTT